MTIYEPMTFTTDLVLAAATLYWGVRLWQEGQRSGEKGRTFFGGAFVASGCGALLGGVFHAIGEDTLPLLRFVLWKGTVWAVGMAGLLLLAGAAQGTLTGRPRRWLTGAALLQFVVYAAWMSCHDAFIYVIADYAPALLVVLVLQGMSYAWQREASARWIAAGIILSFAAAAIQALRLAPHPRFNHNDLYHLVQLVAMWLIYRGGRMLRDRKAPA